MLNKQSEFATGPVARVMIVDDHPIVREGLAALIANYPDLTVSAQADDIAGALRQYEQTPPDIIVIDICLKGESGLELIRRIKDRNSAARILAVSMHDENTYGERALMAGALGYLSKQAAGRNIIAGIRHVLSGKVYVSDGLSDRILTRNLRGNDSATSGVSLLTDRELEVFSRIGLGLTTAEIASSLHLSVKTIETYRQKIKEKLNLRNTAELGREAAQWALANQ